jgi:hypothetical protein
MDYITTYELYKRIDQAKKFEDSPDFHRYKKEQKWFETVKSARTNEFYQADELLRREMVPSDWKSPHVDKEGKSLTYPVKHTTEIFRIKTSNGEFVKSRQQWYGLDMNGNPLNISMDDKEMFDDILPIYTVKEERPGFKDTKMIREVANIEHRRKYTEPYTPETIQRLYDMKNGACGLVLKDETSDSSPYSIPSRLFEDFKNKSFDSLLEYASTPKQKFEPTDSEEHKQYG